VTIRAWLTGLLDLAPVGRDHQLDQFLRDFGFESFGVSLAKADEIGDEHAIPCLLYTSRCV